MSTRYVPIVESEFRGFIEGLKFSEVSLPHVTELTWDRDIPNRCNESGSYAIRVFSTITRGLSREAGQDAIRVLLYDKEANRPMAVEKRVHRTLNALTNMEERCRDVWAYATSKENRCPKCGRLMHKITPKDKSKKPFMSCTGYGIGVCKFSRNV